MHMLQGVTIFMVQPRRSWRKTKTQDLYIDREGIGLPFYFIFLTIFFHFSLVYGKHVRFGY
jgi:hypothetical protein